VRKLLLICFLLGSFIKGFCQAGKLTGTVEDAETKVPLELATISIFGQDSSLISYQLSDKNGRFTIEKLPIKKNLVVSVTYTGYVGYRKSLQLDGLNTDTLAVLLALNNNDTNAVVVTAVVPVRMNGDTLEINPAAFKMKDDAVVEELLTQVSGITIWSDGAITINGRKVQSLLVDGKQFLGSSDSRIATQNLPKSAIDRIQIYQEYDRSKIDQVQLPQDSLLTMNIKLKENSKKGYFGKMGAGYGTRERFEADLSFQVYNKQSSAGIGGGLNNINKNIGNIQEMFQNSTYRNFNPNLYNVGRFGTNGINKNHSIGGVFTHSFLQTSNSRQNNQVVGNYNKSGTDAYITDVNLQSRTTIVNPQMIREEGIQNFRNDRHDFGINYFKTNSYNDNLRVNGIASANKEEVNSTRYTEVRDTADNLQSTNTSTARQNRQSDNESLNVSFTKSNTEEPIKSFSLQLDAGRSNLVSERDVRTVFQSFTDASQNTSFDRRYITHNNSINIRGTLDYIGFKRMLLRRYNLFGVDIRFSQWLNYLRTVDDNRVSDYDSTSGQYIVNGNLSNQNRREVFEYTPSLFLSKNFYKVTQRYYRTFNVQFKLGREIIKDKNLSSFAKRNLDRSFQFSRYEGGINFQYQEFQKIQYSSSLNYTRNIEYPSIDQLYTIVDDINVYDIRIGNPNLLNRIDHAIQLRGSFNTQNPKSVYSINSIINGEFIRSSNAVTESIINDFSGKRTSYYINADKSHRLNLNYNFNISRRLKKSSIQLMYNGRFSNNVLSNYIDNQYNVSETSNLLNQLTLQFSLRSLFIVNVGQTLQHYKTEQTAAGLTSFKNTNTSTKFGIVLNYPSNFTFSSTIENIDNSDLDKPTILWNAFTTYRFMKQQGELKFSAMDLLKQFKNITNSVNSLGTSTRITNGLQQFFLLTFSYYPRKFGNTEIKKPEL
jgi:hypothetical protein